MPHFGPYGEIHRIQAEVNRLIEALMEQRRPGAANWHPPIDIVVDESSTIVEIVLPGVRAEDIQVELSGLMLSVDGRKQRLASEPSGGNYQLMERFFGAFDLIVELPRAVDPRAVTAVLKAGILRVTLPHVVDRRRRSFTIEIEEEDE